VPFSYYLFYVDLYDEYFTLYPAHSDASLRVLRTRIIYS
jgi:hypothetical protein